MRIALAVLAGALVVGCGQGSQPAHDLARRVADPRPGKRVVATIEGFFDGTSLTLRPAGAASSAALVEIPVVQDGTPGTNPPDTLELVTGNIAFPVVNGCGPGVNSIDADVTVRSFYSGATFSNVYVEILQMTPTGREACNSASPAPDGTSNWFGLFKYLDLGRIGTGLNSSTVLWRLRLPDVAPFTFTGRVVADVLDCAQAKVALGTADGFAVLGGTTVTNTGPTSVTGDLGLYPGTSVTGFPPGTISGIIFAGVAPADAAQASLVSAYAEAASRTLCAVSVSGNLGGTTLAPGLYKSGTSLEITSGTLTLDAQGNPDAVFVFQMGSTLTTTSGFGTALTGSAKATNVFWQVGSSATVGAGSALHGTLMADQSITLVTGASLDGRALARAGAVTLDSNTIFLPAP